MAVVAGMKKRMTMQNRQKSNAKKRKKILLNNPRTITATYTVSILEIKLGDFVLKNCYIVFGRLQEPYESAMDNRCKRNSQSKDFSTNFFYSHCTKKNSHFT